MPDIIRLGDRISYIKATENPLSGDVGLIYGERFLWLYDVGNNAETTAVINSIPQAKIAVLSHFHPDHIGALADIRCERVYLSAKTKKYTGCGEAVDDDLYIDDGIKLHVLNLPSSHAQGSIALEAGDYCFLGDGTYATVKSGATVYNAGLLQAQIKELKSLSAKYFLLSHDERFVIPREEVIAGLERIYARREKNDPYIKAK